MKLKADRATLLRALAHIQSVAEKRNTIPILANVLIEARDGKLRLTATDMEIAVEEESDASVEREGRTTAPAATLYEIVRRLPDGSTVELDHPGGDAALALRAGRYATSLNVLPVEDFPNMTAGKLPCQFVLAPDILRDLIDRTRFAISTEETRYYLNGIFLHHGGGKLRAAATDGHRLARVETDLPEGAAEIPGVIIPRKTVGEIRKLLDEGSVPVRIALSDTRIRFEVGPVRLTSKLIDGTFPDYERVIPQDNDKILHVGRKEFSDAVARVAAISQERSRPVKMSLSPNVLVLSAASPDQGTASETLDDGRATYDAEPLEIGFQARYLNDITDHIKETVEFRFADGSAPTVVQDTADGSALYVLMPMRV